MKNLGYFSTYTLTIGFIIAATGSLFIYASCFGYSNRVLESFFSVVFFLMLMRSGKEIWFWSGFFIGALWFWWISLSMIHYGLSWAIPVVISLVSFVYGSIFWLAAAISEKVSSWTENRFGAAVPFCRNSSPVSLGIKVISLLLMSYIHPFGFDWFKPELVFVQTVFGVEKWRFLILMLFVSVAICSRKPIWLLGIMLSVDMGGFHVYDRDPSGRIELAAMRVPVKYKWDRTKLSEQINDVFFNIDRAIKNRRKLIVFPESTFPLFLNREGQLLERIKNYSREIDIVVGALYGDGNGNRNSVYFFHEKRMSIADKVVLVPFGESNPLPDWAGRIVNSIFFDGAPDYRPASAPEDFLIDGRRYRIAVCYEGTSEVLYRDHPENMILISNNGWFVPSTEPALQKLLLGYYSRKYGTEIYHSANMSDSYVIKSRQIHFRLRTEP